MSDWQEVRPARARRKIVVYDTTLRDGAQGPDVSFSAADKERIGPLPCNRSKSRIDLAASAGTNDLHLQPHGATSQLHLP